MENETEKRITILETQQDIILKKVSNCIPTKIENLEKRLVKDIDKLENKIDSINDKLLWGFVAVIASSLIMQVVIKFVAP